MLSIKPGTFVPARDVPFRIRAVAPASAMQRVGDGPGRGTRILCFGDSITSGWFASGSKASAYGKSLKEAFDEVGVATQVSVHGMTGSTAQEMAETMAEAGLYDMSHRLGKGLLRLLHEDGPFDVVLIMAGTNDLLTSSPEEITTHVMKLHTACHACGVPTVALAPSGGWRDRWRRAWGQRDAAARLLEAWSQQQPMVLAFFDVEELVPREGLGDGLLWDADGIHLTDTGSMVWGRRLANRLLPLFYEGTLQCDSVRGPPAPLSGADQLLMPMATATLLQVAAADAVATSLNGGSVMAEAAMVSPLGGSCSPEVPA